MRILGIIFAWLLAGGCFFEVVALTLYAYTGDCSGTGTPVFGDTLNNVGLLGTNWSQCNTADSSSNFYENWDVKVECQSSITIFKFFDRGHSCSPDKQDTDGFKNGTRFDADNAPDLWSGQCAISTQSGLSYKFDVNIAASGLVEGACPGGAHTLPTTSSTWQVTPTESFRSVLNGKLRLTVSNATASQFIQDDDVQQILTQSIANFSGVPVSYVYNVSVRFATGRLLFGRGDLFRRQLSQTTEFEFVDVDVQWKIIIPHDAPNSITAAIVLDKGNSAVVADVTRQINELLSAGIFGNPYEVSVKWVYVEEEHDENEIVPTDQGEQSSGFAWLAIVASSLAVLILVSVSFLWFSQGYRRGRHRTWKVAATREEFNKIAGPLAQSSLLELLLPPEAISRKQGEDVRMLARAMLHYQDMDARVFITYGHGERSEDAEGCGPGMYFAAAVMKKLYDSKIKSVCDLVLPSDVSRTVITSRLARCTNTPILLVLQTRALYNCKHSLMEIYTAQRSDLQIIPLRFEEKLPTTKEQWPTIVDTDLEGVLMITEVQAKFGTFNSIPSPPYTVADQPTVLDDLIVDLKLKLRESTNLAADANDIDLSHSRTDSVETPFMAHQNISYTSERSETHEIGKSLSKSLSMESTSTSQKKVQAKRSKKKASNETFGSSFSAASSSRAKKGGTGKAKLGAKKKTEDVHQSEHGDSSQRGNEEESQEPKNLVNPVVGATAKGESSERKSGDQAFEAIKSSASTSRRTQKSAALNIQESKTT